MNLTSNGEVFEVRRSTFDGGGNAKLHAFIQSKRRLLNSKTVERRTSSVERRAERGFNMVEVSLAIALVGMAIVSIFGLFVVGLDASRDAQDDSLVSTFVQAVVSDRQSAPFDSYTPSPVSETTYLIPPLSSPTNWPYMLYFKKSGGIPLPDSNTNNVGNARPGYYYEVDMRASTNQPNMTVFDLRVSWPANTHLTNRTSAFYYTTTISRH